MTYPPIETVAFIGVGAMVIPMTGHLQQRFGLGLIAEAARSLPIWRTSSG